MSVREFLKKSNLILTATLITFLTGCEDEPAMPDIGEPVAFSTSSNAFTVKSSISTPPGVVINEVGMYWSLTPNPDESNNTGSGELIDTVLFCRVEKLDPGTKYYLRLFAETDQGKVNSDVLEITTNSTITDFDGNNYNTVTIGQQTWLAENLRTTSYNDGTSIPKVTKSWSELTASGFCWYDFNDVGNNNYGPLYNWPAVNSGKLCPDGWHVPDDTEWNVLDDYLGGIGTAGGYLKATGEAWESPNLGATNYAGFNALPGGCSSAADGNFTGKGVFTTWWTSSTDYYFNENEGMLITRSIFWTGPVLTRDGFLSRGGPLNFLSVRCMKNPE